MEETRGARCKLVVRNYGTPKARQDEEEGDSKINRPMVSDQQSGFCGEGACPIATMKLLDRLPG
ncbi:hypothetical protein PHLH4_51920 [Pseudomonas sp. St316]|nr:hypothetical protein PHLH4_51920 [Pseudomonas sp. St316]